MVLYGLDWDLYFVLESPLAEHLIYSKFLFIKRERLIKIDFKEKKITITEKEEAKLTISGNDLKKV
jgi:hypothetical protein